MARPLSPLKLNIELQDILQTIARSREAPHGLVQRARIVLGAITKPLAKTWDYVKRRLAFGENAGLTTAMN